MVSLEATVENGKLNGKPIIRAWESFTGWYWLATEHVEGDVYFGFVAGIYPEWGYFSAAELAANKPMVWELKRSVIRMLDLRVRA